MWAALIGVGEATRGHEEILFLLRDKTLACLVILNVSLYYHNSRVNQHVLYLLLIRPSLQTDSEKHVKVKYDYLLILLKPVDFTGNISHLTGLDHSCLHKFTFIQPLFI